MTSPRRQRSDTAGSGGSGGDAEEGVDGAAGDCEVARNGTALVKSNGKSLRRHADDDEEEGEGTRKKLPPTRHEHTAPPKMVVLQRMPDNFQHPVEAPASAAVAPRVATEKRRRDTK